MAEQTDVSRCDSAETRVARGAAWLDEVMPGWERKLDLGILDIATCSRCIVGQIEIRAPSPSCGLEDVGLDTAGSHQSAAGRFEGRLLTDAWVALVKERFNTGNLSA